MTFLGSFPAFAASIALALLLAVLGLAQILLASGSNLLGIVLLFAASGLGGYAKNARAAYLHRRNMADLSEWAQGLGPRDRQERRRL